MRKGLTAAEDLLNAKAHKKKPVQATATVAANTPASGPKERTTAAVKRATKATTKTTKKPVAAARTETPVSKKMPLKAGVISTSKQRGAKQLAAVTAAKQSRVVRSGKTTRMFGHVSARGKRAQARRDTKR